MASDWISFVWRLYIDVQQLIPRTSAAEIGTDVIRMTCVNCLGTRSLYLGIQPTHKYL
jgi:hypothetical protein